MSFLTRMAAGALALGVLAPGAAPAQDVTLNVLYNLPGFTRFHQPIAEAFQKQHPDIRINFLAPAPDYNAGHQQVLRSVVTGDAPDVFFSGYHLLAELTGTLSAREHITDLASFIEADGGQRFLDENFTPQMAALGVVDGVQVGLPVNASSPIMYVNADLVRSVGADPDAMPDTWDALVELAERIREKNEGEALATPPRGRGATPSCSNKRP